MRAVWRTCESRKGDPAASGLALATTYRTASVMSRGVRAPSPALRPSCGACRRAHHHPRRNGANGVATSGRRQSATDDGSGHLVLTAGNPNITSFTLSGADQSAFGLAATAVTGTSTTRNTLQGNYNALLSQIDQLAGDASYNGVNLLTGNNLQVLFNENGTSSLNIAGVNFNSTGLGLSTIAAGGFQSGTTITATETAINSAIGNVRAQTETFGTNSSTIQTRQDFEKNMINTLQTGASNLVLADQNQESANLLTLQTQQQLEISALSIANQANQSVLKLFP